jgi:hypothetical protein
MLVRGAGVHRLGRPANSTLSTSAIRVVQERGERVDFIDAHREVAPDPGYLHLAHDQPAQSRSQRNRAIIQKALETASIGTF